MNDHDSDIARELARVASTLQQQRTGLDLTPQTEELRAPRRAAETSTESGD